MNDNDQDAITPNTLARQVIELAKASILADNHFLATALGRLELAPSMLAAPLATDGACLAYDSKRVLAAFKETGNAPTHDVLHSVLHCLFVHPYADSLESSTLWDLACDIAAERAAVELVGPRSGERGAGILRALARIERETGARSHAERIYREMRHGRWSSEIGAWSALFASDSHELWHKPAASQGESDGQGAGAGTDRSAGVGRSHGDADSIEHAAGESGQKTTDAPQSQGSTSGQDVEGAGGFNPQKRPRDQHRAPSQGRGTQAGTAEAGQAADGTQRNLQQRFEDRRERERAQWRNVAMGLAVNLQTMSARRGQELAGLVDDLNAASTQRADYASFLRRFATPGEALHLNDEEFDQIFYTFGMQLYNDMPLIEPLEYREEQRIREFAIVIDTSESVQGSAIRAFVTTTFDLLKTTEAFFESIRVHIIQCDAAVQTDDVLNSPRDLDHWNRTMHIHGGGGTDFRPAFAYVDNLVEQGEFLNLGGLVYFTDGKGTYPEWVPRYQCAFAFYDEDHNAADAPPWATQIVLSEDDLARAAGSITRKETSLI